MTEHMTERDKRTAESAARQERQWHRERVLSKVVLRTSFIAVAVLVFSALAAVLVAMWGLGDPRVPFTFCLLSIAVLALCMIVDPR